MTTATKTKKKVEDILVLYVIDRSGSMAGLSQAVCDGFNTFVEEQATLDGQCLVSVTMFDTEFEVPVVAEDAKTLPKMNMYKGPLQFMARGGTALRDAIGITIKGGEAWLKNHPEFSGKVLMCVQTDGGENASTQFTPSQIRSMVEQKQGEGWTIIFQGSNNSFLQASDLGVKNEFTQPIAATHQGYVGSFTTNSVGTTNLRSFGSYTIS